MQETKLWDHLLSGAPKDSILMGGAVVDSLWAKTPKDYDIFYSYKPGLPDVPVNWQLTEQDFNDPDWIEQHQAQYMQGMDEHGNLPIGSVYEYVVDGEHIVQLVGVHYDKPIKHFKNFDHSFTLGWYSKQGLFVHREVFKANMTGVIRYISKVQAPEARLKSYWRAVNKAVKYEAERNWVFEGFDAVQPAPQPQQGVALPF